MMQCKWANPVVYSFSFIEEGIYEQVAFFKAPQKMYNKAGPFIYSEYKNTHLSDFKL